MLKKIILATLSASISLSLFSSMACAGQINVYPPKLNFTGQVMQNIHVANATDHKVYVKVNLEEITHPGMKNQKSVSIQPNAIPFQVGLAITPRKFILPPKGQQDVRVMAFGQPKNNDKVFLVNIAPVSGGIIVHEKAKLKKGHETAAVRILEGYGIRVMIRPKTPIYKLSPVRNGKSVTIKNTGNSNVLLVNAKQCIHNKCHSLNLADRVYAGNTWKVKLPYNAPVRFTKVFINKISQFYIK